jgi:serine/threonine-protein kinase
MAELFLAQEPPKPELVVLKRILPYLSEETEFVQMFLDEARIAAQLHHPNIVQVYELGKLDNTIFIAMEFVEGVDLRRVVQEENKFGATVPYGVAAAICAQVAEGLDYAHFSKDVHGVPLELIHRDVSPQNVMVGYNGRVKIVDFGIAKAGTYVNRSKPGVIKGKFLYLSPEQVAQDKLDHRADIFALGTMMYEITTGKSPFAKPTTEGILYAIRSEDPSPPHLIKDDYPIELSRIIMRCLVKDRAQRYQRAAEVQADLKTFLASGVIKQSTDISDYIARLMGEEEERTVLHIPVASAARKDATAALAPSFSPVARKDATAAMSPGLMARPRRNLDTPPAPPVPDEAPEYDDEQEPPTQMARPAELLAQKALRDAEADEADDEDLDATADEGNGHADDNDFEDQEDDETGADVSTAIGTLPVTLSSSPAEPGESTVQERGRGRSSAPGGTVVGRRSMPPLDRDTEPRARRPSAPRSRRPLAEEELPPSDPSAPSISLTQPTGNQSLFDEEEEEERADEDSAYDAAANSISVTPPTTGQRRRLGDNSHSSPVTAATTGQRRRLLDDSSKSSPDTQPSVNMRGSRQRQALLDEEPPPDTDAGVADDLDDDANPTEGLPANLEDDESTAGYDNESKVSAQRSRGLILAAVGVVVLLLLALGLYWALNPGDQVSGVDGPQPPSPITPTQAAPTPTPGPAPTESPDSPAVPPAADNPGPAVAAAGENLPTPTPGASEPTEPGAKDPQANPPGGTPGTETTVVAANGSGSSPSGEPATAEGGSTVPAGTETAETPPSADITFKTNSATFRVDRKPVEANKLLSFRPGTILVEWSCAKKWKREGSDRVRLKSGKNPPFEVRCRKGSR